MEYTVISGTEMNVFANCARHVGYRWLDVGRTQTKENRFERSRRPRQRDQPDRHGAGLRFWVSEEIVGKAIEERGHREKVFIATKVGLEWHNGSVSRNSSAGRIRKEVQDSLRRLRTDYIDIYQVHWPDSAIPIEETARTMQALFRKA